MRVRNTASENRAYITNIRLDSCFSDMGALGLFILMTIVCVLGSKQSIDEGVALHVIRYVT